MAELKAYIQWEIINDNGEVSRSSYEHISDIDDAQNWVDHMSECLEDADCEEPEDEDEDDE